MCLPQLALAPVVTRDLVVSQNKNFGHNPSWSYVNLVVTRGPTVYIYIYYLYILFIYTLLGGKELIKMYFLKHLLVFLQTILQDAWFNHQEHYGNLKFCVYTFVTRWQMKVCVYIRTMKQYLGVHYTNVSKHFTKLYCNRVIKKKKVTHSHYRPMGPRGFCFQLP
jgi:hypothetical protein